MPELPEVHTTVEGLKKTIVGKIIKDVWSDFYINTAHANRQNVKNKKYFDNLKKIIIGSKIIGSERIGKHVVLHLENKYSLIIHMKMTGHLLCGNYEKVDDIWKAKENGPLKDSFNQFIHFLITLKDRDGTDSHLALSDMRKFASASIIKSDEIRNHPSIKDLGEDALKIKPKKFVKKIIESSKVRKKMPIKTLLMDQGVVAGIGNIYSDESLWASKIHPESFAYKIPDKKILGLFNKTVAILKKSIKLGGDSMSDYRNIKGERGSFQNCHKAYRNTNKKCQMPLCKGVIRRKVIKTRSAHFCDSHQIFYK